MAEIKQQPDRIVSSHELAEEFAKLPRPAKVATGFGSLDRLLDGSEGGEVVLILGPTGGGKSVLLSSIMQRMAKDEIPTLFFSLEMGARMILDRMSSGGTLPLFYLPRQTHRYLDWMEEKIKESVRNFGVRAVFIENLKDIRHREQKFETQAVTYAYMINELKQFAIENDVPVFLTHHPTGEATRSTSELAESDARGSQEVPDTAAVVLGVWRTKRGDTDPKRRPRSLDEDDNWGKVKILKNRRTGKLGWFLVEHNNHLFTEVDTQYERV